MRFWAVVVAAGCSGGGGSGAEIADPAPAPAPPTPAAAGPSAEAEILAKGPPAELGPVATVFGKVAEIYGVGLVRCPLAGGGRAREAYGTERDLLLVMGPTWGIEVDPAKGPPWDPLFDEVTSENDWVTMLAVPGATKGWVASKVKTLEYEFPPAVAGQTVTCTAVRAAGPRVVRGKVNGTIPPNTRIVPCNGDQAPTVGADGAFLAQVQTPCTLWAASPVSRSEAVRVDDAPEPLEVALTLQPDPLVEPGTGAWTEEGKKQLRAVLEREKADAAEAGSVLDQLWANFEQTPISADKVKRWKFDQATWARIVDQALHELENPTAPRPRDQKAAHPR